MSIIKSIKQVLGLGPAAENHFWDGSVPNQLSLKRGTPDAPGATVLQVVNGKITQLASAQTLQNVKASRVPGTNYTNDTGQTITVMVSGTSSMTAAITAVVNGNTIYGSAAGVGTISAITFSVPNGGIYQIGASAGVLTVAEWAELR